MAGTDLVQRTQEIVSTIDGDDFRDRVAPLLPDTVPYRRFCQIAKTAIRANPDLAGTEQRSLFNAIIRCAEAGLYPNNEDAALVPYKGKVTFIPMVDGVRKIAAEYGWDIRARVVYAEDDFDYSEEPAVLRHKPVRPGMDRGDRIAVYAIAVHRDGRRRQRVLYADEIAKRRAKAQTTRVWDEFPDPMWMKSAIHAIYDELPRAERDLMSRFDAALAETEPEDAAALLYGENGATFHAREIAAAPTESAEHESPSTRDEGPGTGGDRQQATSAAPAGVVPGEDDEPEPTMPIGQTDEELRAAAEVVADTKIPNGLYEGVALREVAAIGEDGHGWIEWALSNPAKFEGDFHAALETFVQGFLPDLWAQHTQRQAA